MKARLEVPKELLARYATSAPRYTSYPTAVDWEKDPERAFDPTTYGERLAAAATARPDEAISLYTHIPYCAELCLFCGCNVQISRSAERRERYLEAVEQELGFIEQTGIQGRAVKQFHWGGGTPTSLDPDQLERLFGSITSRFRMAEGAEVSIEVDPRVTTPEQIERLAALGFNRISMGVQDFEPDVQQAIKRVQSEELTRNIIQSAREAGMRSVNIDLIYGLPHQTRDGFKRTVETTLDIAPERVALFHYAHVPWMKKHQAAMDVDAMPSAEEKLDLFADSIDAFDGAGYVYLGLDHFALPEDELSVAAADGSLHRNFMGYTTQRGREMVSLGVSSIGEVDGCYVQNIANEPEYVRDVAERGFATYRGHAMTPEDQLRRDIILELMCNGRIDKRRIEAEHSVDFDATFSLELDELKVPATDGLVTLGTDLIQLTPVGQVLMRNIAAPFDRYLRERKARGETGKSTFSKTL
ncbi:MAG: oxygen-independent coproporphyrinogen III oxidase [Planctomycetota bacterium]|nr:oxygen-independent coproporphyrinogen III oxidase [Planctomycetota bacterium]MDG1983108.1 oxygen-independent coproporphyrinogen III oxidase [Planctomycetota bacterium]